MNVKSMFIIAGCIYAFMVFTGRMSVSDLTDFAAGSGSGRGSSSFGSAEKYRYSTFGETKRMSDYEPWQRGDRGREDRMPSW